VEVRWFRPLSWYDINRLNNRTHRKVLVVDGEIAFTGGVGIAEEWTGHAQDRHHWRDTHIRVEGPAARGLQGAFVDNWFEATSEVLVGDHYLTAQPDRGEAEEAGHTAQVIRSTASNYDTNIETLFMLVIATARQHFWLTTAYFVPTAAFIQALRDAAKRGVDVKVLTPGPRTNKKLVRRAGRANYAPLLEAGVHIYEFEPTMLHCKTLVVDGVWGTVGSTNFDNRSFALNDEINICFREAEPVSNLEKQFQLDLERATEIKHSDWKTRGPLERLVDWVSDWLNPEL
jgi:cardiolipin synthase